MKKEDIGLTILTTTLFLSLLLAMFFGYEYLTTRIEISKYEPLTALDKLLCFCVVLAMGIIVLRFLYIIFTKLKNWH